MRLIGRLLPILVVVLSLLFLGSRMRPAPEPEAGQFNLDDFGKLPVKYDGRIKPVDTLARTSLMVLRNRQTLRLENGETMSAVQWLMALLTDQERWAVVHVPSLPNESDIEISFRPGLISQHLMQANAWRTAVGLPAVSAAEIMANSRRVPVAGGEALVMDLTGPAGGQGTPRRVLAALVPERQNTWIIQLAASAEQVAAVEQDFLLFLGSMNWPAGGEEKPSSMRFVAPAFKLPAGWSMSPAGAGTLKVFRVDDPRVINLFDTSGEPGKYYSFYDVIGGADKLLAAVTDALAQQPWQRDTYQRNVLKLNEKLHLYQDLALLSSTLAPPLDSASTDEGWEAIGGSAGDPRRPRGQWTSVDYMQHLLAAYHFDKPKDFNQILGEYHDRLARHMPNVARRSNFEAWFNRFEPFFLSMILLVITFLLACMSLVGWREPLRRSAFWLLAVVLVVFAFGLGSRIWIQGRPPVTNLYSSAIFIGWIAVALALVLEKFFRNGIGTLAASVIGFATLLIAHNLSFDGDTMESLRAVLDTNFWLATHVVCITIGYSATYFAGVLALIYIIMGVFTPALRSEFARALGRAIYGSICFALLFSFVGTVLGGIWADQSWGRFWGWDPKENGALIIVIWNALILHARWAGLARQRGMAVLAVFGNIVTTWSWFGTNMLQVGLHSYGFMDGAMRAMFLFMASQLIVMAVGMLPFGMWWSVRASKDRPAVPLPVDEI